MTDDRRSSVTTIGENVAIGENNMIVNNHLIPNMGDLPPGTKVTCNFEFTIPQQQQQQHPPQHPQQQQEQQQQEQQPQQKQQSRQQQQQQHQHQAHDTRNQQPQGQTQPPDDGPQQPKLGQHHTRPKNIVPTLSMSPLSSLTQSCENLRIIAQETNQEPMVHQDEVLETVTERGRAPERASLSLTDSVGVSYISSASDVPAMPMRSVREKDTNKAVKKSSTDLKGSKTAVKSLASMSLSPHVPLVTRQVQLMPSPPGVARQPKDVTVFKTLPGVVLSDIAVVTTPSKTYIAVSDTKEKRIFYITICSRNSNVLYLSDSPLSVTSLPDGCILIGLAKVKRFLIFDLEKKQQQIINTSRVYAAMSVRNNCEVVACSPDVLDIMDLKGKILKSFPLNKCLKSPGYICASTQICVTDCKANTLTCFNSRGDRELHVQIPGKSRDVTLCGVAQNGSDVYAADASGHRILDLTAVSSCSQAKVILDKEDGILKPRGLCVSDGSVYIAEEDGAIKMWKLENSTSTRL